MYSLKKNGEYFDIVEENTNATIKKLKNLIRAQYYLKIYKRGGGFNGFTPTFMIKNK